MRFLLGLSDYYMSNTLFKSINISILKTKFLLLISRQNFNITNEIAYINNIKVKLYSIFEYYSCRGLYFFQLFFYKYFRLLLIVNCKCKQEKDYKFDDIHFQRKIF